MNKRQSQIIEMLTQEKKLDVTVLSERLQVSQVTIRKDLDKLDEEGYITREHGYALIKQQSDISGSIAYNYSAKQAIAKRAIKYVKNGSAVLIDSGSCCALLAEKLCKKRKDLTIITTSSYIADLVVKKSDFQTILLGGIYQKETQSSVGPMVKQAVGNYFVDNLFISVDGFSLQTGFTTKYQLQAEAIKDMAERCSKVVILTDSDEIKDHGITPISLPSIKKIVVTDSKVSSKTISEFVQSGIEIVLV